ncbi:hypothetical protein MMA231_02501 [Asticcacaulis sp. MM231]|uniref:contractile injection system protein, VgrG/Pvc8 family n=1 Tax=Asticcacaulis sp. MM231 TaxID=3157666 RepID=UPI0032D59574
MTSQPSVLPKAAWKVEQADKDITDRINPRLLALTLTEKRGNEADELEIRVDDRDGTVAMPKKGVVLQVWLGWERGTGLPQGLVYKGTFKVDERSLSGPPDIITIRARSADFTDTFKVRKQRSFVGQTVKTIMSAIAADNGLKLSIDADLGAKVIPALGHTAKSDAALLKLLGKRFDAVATVKSGTLIFSPIGKSASPGGKAIPTETIDRKQTSPGFTFSEPDRGTYDGVEAKWHNKATNQQETVVVGGSAEPKAKLLRKVYANEADARTAAEAEQGRMERGKATMSFPLALGRPDIFPDRPIRLTGWKAEVNAIDWLVIETSHSMDGNGALSTRLSLEAAAKA